MSRCDRDRDVSIFIRMKIHALQTGSVRVKKTFLHPSPGRRRQLDLFLPGEWSTLLPIHCWAIEHGGKVLLVDSGETVAARNVPFARFEVTGEQEIPGALAARGLSPADVAEVGLTPPHGGPPHRPLHLSAPGRGKEGRTQVL